MSDNPVIRGYRWAQHFECPPETLEPFDVLEAEIYWSLRRDRAKPPRTRRWIKISTQSADTAGRILFDGQIIQVELPASVTKYLELTQVHALKFDFKRIRADEEVYLGARFEAPVHEPYTKGQFG